MRKLIVTILIIAAVIVVAALVVPSLVNINRYHDQIQTQLQKRLGRQVSLGQMRLRVLPLAIRVTNAVIGEDPAFRTRQPFALVQELDVRAKLWPLLRGQVEVQSLNLRRPQIELVRNQQGIWNFASLGRAGTQGPSKSAEVSIADLKIEDGQVALTDLEKRQARTVYDHIDLAVSGYAPEKTFDFSGAAHLPGTGAQMLNVSGKMGPVNQVEPLNTPFDGTLKLDQISVSSVQKFFNSPALTGTDATASGETHIRNQEGKLESDGNLTLDKLRLRGVEVEYPITAQFNITDDLNSDLLAIGKGSLKLGSTPLSVTGTVNLRPTPIEIDLRVSALNVSIDEAARLAAAAGVAFSPGMTIKGQLNADLRAQGAATRPAMNGTVSARNLDISGKELPQPVKVDTIELALSPQAIRSNNFSAAAGDTRVDAQFTLTAYTSPDPNIDLSLRTNRANLGELLSIAKAYGVSALNGTIGSGTLTLDLRATGPVKNSAAMNFSGSGQVQNASLRGPQLTQPLGIANANIGFTRNSIVLQNLSASLGETHATGNLTLRDFNAPQVQFTLAADKINVSELEQMFSSGPPQPQKRAAFSLVPSALAAPTNDSLLAKATGSGTLTIGTVIYDQLLLSNVRSNATLDRGVVRLAPLTADVYGGQETGSITIDTRPTPMTYAVNTKLTRVDANKLISSVSSIKQTLYGLLAANANTTFRSAPADQIARTLNGSFSLDLRNGRLVGMDLLNQLASIGKFVGYSRAPEQFTNLAQLTGNFNVTNGLAQTNDLKAVIDGGTMAADGAVNLADQTLNMRV
ncbi:MAG TPA: AsmA family protein, partial [Terriglobales bacterium]|nr:AsmA family protein [Terriglobales bacterium]